MNSDSRFFWVDLEMTGLDVSKDVILEIASIVTDAQLNIIAYGPSYVIHQTDEILAAMIPLVQALHKQSGLTELVKTSTISLEQASRETYEFMKKHCSWRNTFLAGNTVWMDRMFLALYMPDLVKFMHYRLIDVSSIKILTKIWYPEQFAQITPDKKGGHRALDDIKESIEELKRYKTAFFV
jgi:oligoribonuclease